MKGTRMRSRRGGSTKRRYKRLTFFLVGHQEGKRHDFGAPDSTNGVGRLAKPKAVSGLSSDPQLKV